MADRPADAPEHCPGTQSEEAGKVSACAGCPNQQICSSGAARAPDPGIELVKQRLSSIKHKYLILSGKGGVGKSTVSSLLARAFASQDTDKNDTSEAPFEKIAELLNKTSEFEQVGLLDIDVCGPSQPRMMNVVGEQVHMSGSGWSPVYVDENLAVMSIGFLLASVDDAVIWRGPKKNMMIRQFLSDVDWGELEYLVIDTPPGTSDEHLSAATYLSNAGLDGAVIVTTPQEVALLDVRKEIDFCRKTGIQVIGVIENMTTFVCPKCKIQSTIFPPDSGGASAMAKELNVPFLGSIPLDPLLARACDEGKNIFVDFPQSPVCSALTNIVKGISGQQGGEAMET